MHQVVTEDGYILEMYRIPGMLTEDLANQKNKPPVLCVHGLESDMMQWVVNRPEVAPAFVLARNGYDVWMGNNRGNRFSDKHTKLDPASEEYWTFDWEDMGTKDTPAFINHILSYTGYDKLSYIGHSEGTTQLVSGATLMPDFYKEKLNLAILLAPALSMKNNSVTLLEFLSTWWNRELMVAGLKLIKQFNIIPYTYTTSGSQTLVCKILNGKICKMILGMLFD